MIRLKIWFALASSSLLLLACDGDASPPTWGDVFVELGSTALSDSSLLEIGGSVARAGERPIRPDFANTEARFIYTVAHGERLAHSVMDGPPDVLATPYWSSWARLLGARSSELVFSALNLRYPIYIYRTDGTLLDSLPDPPPSWRQARQPVQGEFASQDPERIAAYLRSFSVLTGLASFAGSILLVSRGQLRHVSDAHGPWAWHRDGESTFSTRQELGAISEVVDVYMDGKRIITDHEAPGELFGSSGETVFFLRRDPSGDGWTLIEYGIRR